MQAPATHQNTDQQRAGNTPRRFHITHHIDVDGTRVTLCGKRISSQCPIEQQVRPHSIICPLCDATHALNEVQL
ncbi:hypothetical protein WG936_05245 [Corynebacterium sp. H127]|uniref:hypothetical protein n=1 Tax=Corynebacterium sp. H127 TaxID=3133418 RepID=UPI003097AEC2